MKNTVLIGFGYWGPNIARNIKNSRKLNLYGICDTDETKLSKARTLYGDSVRYYRDYKEVVRHSEVEAVAVALRNDIAQVVARAVLSSQKHLFMEKPLATKMSDAMKLRDMAKENGVVIHVDHILIFNPFIRKIKEMVSSGDIGEMLFFDSSRINLGPHIKNDMNAMWDLAVHDLAVVDHLYGPEEPERVECLGIKKYSKKEVLTYLTVKYNSFVAMYKSSWISPLKERLMVIGGTKKMIVFDDLKDSEKLMVYDKGFDINNQMFSEYGKYETKVRTGDLYVPYIESEDSLLNSLDHFADCIYSGQASIANADQAIRILNILEAANKKLREGNHA